MAPGNTGIPKFCRIRFRHQRLNRCDGIIHGEAHKDRSCQKRAKRVGAKGKSEKQDGDAGQQVAQNEILLPPNTLGEPTGCDIRDDSRTVAGNSDIDEALFRHDFWEPAVDAVNDKCTGEIGNPDTDSNHPVFFRKQRFWPGDYGFRRHDDAAGIPVTLFTESEFLESFYGFDGFFISPLANKPINRFRHDNIKNDRINKWDTGEEK